MIEERRYEVRVENIFEGPMDLLVYLIKKNEVDIYDIPIALITDQYLEYMEWIKAMNIDTAGEFLFMAATLAHIKSRMLLPVHDASDEDGEDPRMEIARPLLEYLRMKSVADQLAEADCLGEDVFTRQPDKDLSAVDRSEQMVHVGLFELVDAFRRILEKTGGDLQLQFGGERFSIKDKIAAIIERLEIHESATLEDMLADTADREEVVVTFLAILELARLNLIRILQQAPSGVIRIIYQ